MPNVKKPFGEEITSYYASWDYEDHTGKFIFSWDSNPDSDLDPPRSNWLNPVTVESPAEFQLMLDMLRNEKPVYFDSKNKRLAVGYEPAGEGESRRD